MRLALISDIHGNAVALSHILHDIDTLGVDTIAFLGDLATLGPAPHAVIEMVEALGCTCIMGNHDEFLLDRNLICQYAPAPIVADEVSWCRAQLGHDELAFLATFERTKRLQLNDSAEILLFHGSPRSHMDILLETTPDAELDSKLGGQYATLMAGGHTHLQMTRWVDDCLLINPGSVGHPFVEYANGGVPKLKSCAEYCVISAEDNSINIDLRRVPIERSKLRAAALAANNPMRDWLASEYS